VYIKAYQFPVYNKKADILNIGFFCFLTFKN